MKSFFRTKCLVAYERFRTDIVSFWSVSVIWSRFYCPVIFALHPFWQSSASWICKSEKFDAAYWSNSIYVICRPRGPHWEKLCQRSWVRPEAAGRGPYPRPRAQFFPIRTDLGRQITCLLFISVEYFVSSFCVEFSLQPFSNLVYACVWHLGNRKSNQHYTHWRKLRNCLFLRSLFTFYVLCSEKKNCWKRRESWKISSGPYAGSGWENPDC